MTSVSTPPITVAIVGAGPAGLCLANHLQQNGTHCVLFEGRSKEEHLMSQGGSVDLYTSTGLAALRAVGLQDAVLKVARTTTRLRVCDKDLVPWLSLPPSGKPEIDREALIRVMVDCLPPEKLRWGHRVLRVDEIKKIHFADGLAEGPFDLVVGADGAWSTIRNAITHSSPTYAGMQGQMLRILKASRIEATLLRAMVERNSSTFAFGDGKAFIAHILRDGSASITLFQIAEQQHGHNCSPEDRLETLCEAYSAWNPQVIEILRLADPSTLRSWPLYMLSAASLWQHRQGVTLIGDAAHLMPPNGGYGVNLALLDAWNLALAIEGATTTVVEDASYKLYTAVHKFEIEMMAAAAQLQEASMKIMKYNLMTPDAPRSTIEKNIMLRAQQELKPRTSLWPLLRPILACLVYGFYGVYKLVH